MREGGRNWVWWQEPRKKRENERERHRGGIGEREREPVLGWQERKEGERENDREGGVIIDHWHAGPKTLQNWLPMPTTCSCVSPCFHWHWRKGARPSKGSPKC